MSKIWFITGASRGLGVEIAKAALRNGDRVVATGRKRSAVSESLGADSEQLLSLALDVTDAAQVQTAVDTAVAHFGGIDVLVNNAGYGSLGYFEENTLADVEAQFATNLFGVFKLTWAVLPLMRAARKGHVFNLSSLAGIRGAEFGSLYCASKFALEGFSESLAPEVAPFGISVTLIEPGPFRTDFLSQESLHLGGKKIGDYDERRTQLQASFQQRNGQQPGDPLKLAEAMVQLTELAKPPMRFIAGRFAVDATAAKLVDMQAELNEWRELGLSTDGNYAS